jgi:hypothetical protein
VRKSCIVACLLAAACASGNPIVSTTTAARDATARSSAGGLIREEVEGMNRVCTYRIGPVGSEAQTYRTGMGQRCPATYPTADPNRPVQPTARLASSEIQRGSRLCTYEQGTSQWTFAVELDQVCPVNAGMAIQAGATQQTAANRLTGQAQ